MEHLRHRERKFFHAISSPFIYAVFFPVVLLDLVLEIYHRVCFPLYGLEYVKRSDYIKIDRYKLSYLNYRQKLNCAYCGYINGFFLFAKEVAGRTEAYWCGITHQSRQGFHAPPNHKNFLPYGDKEAFERFKNSR